MEKMASVSARAEWRLVWIGVAIALLSVSCLPVRREAEPAGGSGDPQPLVVTVVARVGDLAPDFELIDLDGSKVTLSDFRGQVVLLNFWAVWCSYCRAEFPVLQAFYERHQNDRFVVLAINIQESKELVSEYVGETGLTFPVLLDRWGEVTARYRVRGLPTSFLVDREGRILEKHIGPVDESMLDEYLAQSGVQ
jgi:peroxiredoxin